MLPGTVKEDSRKIPVEGQYDVLVIGGGPAGISASVAAARAGARTLLLEQYGFLGGMASAGMVGTFCGFFTSGRQKKLIVGGIGRTVLERLAELNGVTEKITAQVNSKIANYRYNPEVFKYVADTIVLGAHVDVLFHTVVVRAVHEANGYLRGVITENKSGRLAFLGKVLIDATGDGDIAAKAGAPYEVGDGKGTAQSMTTMFRMTNANYEKVRSIDLRAFHKRLEAAKKSKLYDFSRVDGFIHATIPSTTLSANITSMPGLSGIDARQLTQAEIEGRRQVFEYLRFLREHQPGFEQTEVSTIATQVGVRETRRILGEYMLNESDVLRGKKFDDGIALGAWPVELHDSETEKTCWKFLKKEDDYYAIPVSCLIPKDLNNVLVAGRCISTTHVAQASTRVIAQAFATGEAAGVLAGQCAQSRCNPREIDPSEIRKELLDNGAILES